MKTASSDKRQWAIGGSFLFASFMKRFVSKPQAFIQNSKNLGGYYEK